MKKILAYIALAFISVSCVDLSIPPKNIVTSEDLLSNESGIDIYMARMYSNMPFEDFSSMGI